MVQYAVTLKEGDWTVFKDGRPLENALTREALRSQSDGKGLFRFPAVPDGVYVLHIEGGKTARAYAPTDMIVTVSHTATRDSVVLTLSEDGCGFIRFSPQWR